MAMRSGAPVIPAFMVRQKSGNIIIMKPTIEAVCRMIMKRTWCQCPAFHKNNRRNCREYPEQYFWFTSAGRQKNAE